jgi:N-acetylmuramic acid 6-phosphate etherase
MIYHIFIVKHEKKMVKVKTGDGEMENISHLATEKRNVKSMNLDQLSIDEALKLMNEEDQNVPYAIQRELPRIKVVIEKVIEAFERGGRLIYIGAGTSGRLGILDASECPPTFGTPPSQVIGLIAGGKEALIKAVEGAEDDFSLGEEDLKEISVSKEDVIIGLTASGRTPYVLGALTYANRMGCITAGITCADHSELGNIATIPIEVNVGPEVLTGSSRLKAGTAQKLILNMITTLSMVGIGKVYQNLMVDVEQTNVKLENRALSIIMEVTQVSRGVAKEILKQANGNVKTAITMILLDCDLETAQQKLTLTRGHLRRVIEPKEI